MAFLDCVPPSGICRAADAYQKIKENRDQLLGYGD